MTEEFNKYDLNKIKSCDLYKSVKSLIDKNNMLAVKDIYANGPLTKEGFTELSEPALSTALHDMEENSMIMFDDGKYFMTVYGALVIEGLQEIRRSIMKLDETDNLLLNMFSGLLPEDLSEREVTLLEGRFGKDWFEKLGYNDTDHKRPSK